MKKRIMISVLLIVFIVQVWVIPPTIVVAAADNLNLGFESGLEGWTTSGLVTVEKQKVLYLGYIWTVTPWEITAKDESMAVLVANGDLTSMTTLQTIMGLSDSATAYITGNFPDMTDAAYMYRDVIMSAGQSISVSWNYTSDDQQPYNDASFLCMANQTEEKVLPIINGHYSDVTLLASTVPGKANFASGDYSSTGWQTTTITAAYSGIYRLGFVSFNLTDTEFPPYLFVDDFPGTTTKNGEDFYSVGPDDNPPGLLPVVSLTYDNTLFREAISNDGMVEEIAFITLTNDEFFGNIGEPLADVTYINTPAGLTSSIIKTGDHTAKLSFSGKASPNGNSRDINNFQVTMGNGAFISNNASAVYGADTNFLAFDFNNAVYTVKFYDPIGNLIKTELVEEGESATAPTVSVRQGYHFTKWSGEYQEILSNVELYAVDAPNTDTAYMVEYYIPATENDGFVLKEKQQLTGITNTKATAIAKEYAGLTVDMARSKMSGTILPDGTLILNVYYTAIEAPVKTGDETGSMALWWATVVTSIAVMVGIRLNGNARSKPNK